MYLIAVKIYLLAVDCKKAEWTAQLLYFLFIKFIDIHAFIICLNKNINDWILLKLKLRKQGIFLIGPT